MSSGRDPFDGQLIAVLNAIGDIDLQAGDGLHTDAFARHDGVTTNKRLWMHAVLYNGMFMIVMKQVFDISLGLMRKVLFVKMLLTKRIISIRTGDRTGGESAGSGRSYDSA